MGVSGSYFCVKMRRLRQMFLMYPGTPGCARITVSTIDVKPFGIWRSTVISFLTRKLLNAHIRRGVHLTTCVWRSLAFVHNPAKVKFWQF